MQVVQVLVVGDGGVSIWSSDAALVARGAVNSNSGTTVVDTPPTVVEVLDIRCQTLASSEQQLEPGQDSGATIPQTRHNFAIRTSCPNYKITARLLGDGMPVAAGYYGALLELSQDLVRIDVTGTNYTNGTILLARSTTEVQEGGIAQWQQAAIDADAGLYRMAVVLQASMQAGIPVQVGGSRAAARCYGSHTV